MDLAVDPGRSGRSPAEQQVRPIVDLLHGTDDVNERQRGERQLEQRRSLRAARRPHCPRSEIAVEIEEPLLAAGGLVRREGWRARYRIRRGNSLRPDDRHHRSRYHDRQGNKSIKKIAIEFLKSGGLPRRKSGFVLIRQDP